VIRLGIASLLATELVTFEVLRRYSQNHSIKLREVAATSGKTT